MSSVIKLALLSLTLSSLLPYSSFAFGEEKEKARKQAPEEDRDAKSSLPKKQKRKILPGGEGFSELHEAAASGDMEEVKRLLKDSDNFYPANNGMTALHVAAEHGRVEVIRELLRDGRFLAPALHGETALHIAAAHGQIGVVEALLADPNFPVLADNNCWTALHVAARFGQDQVISPLLADPRLLARGIDGLTALHVAAEYGQVRAIRPLLADHRFPVTADDNGWTALHVAARHNQVGAIEALLQDGRVIGARLVQQNPEPAESDEADDADGDGWTALHVAARYNQVEAIQALVRDGRFLAPDGDGWTALHVAARYNQVEVIQALLPHRQLLERARRARFNRGLLDRSEDHSRTALHVAARYGQLAAMRALLPYPDLRDLDNGGWSALHIAAQEGQVAAIRELLRYRCLFEPGNGGEMALDVALINGEIDAARELLAAQDYLMFHLTNGLELHNIVIGPATHGQIDSVRQLIFHFPCAGVTTMQPDLRIWRDHKDEMTEEIRDLIAKWPHPTYNPAFINLYPMHLRNALLLMHQREPAAMDALGPRIVAEYYADPEDFNPYNERNTEARLERHRQEIAAEREQAANEQNQRLATLLGITQNVPGTLDELRAQLINQLAGATPAAIAALFATFFLHQTGPHNR